MQPMGKRAKARGRSAVQSASRNSHLSAVWTSLGDAGKLCAPAGDEFAVLEKLTELSEPARAILEQLLDAAAAELAGRGLGPRPARRLFQLSEGSTVVQLIKRLVAALGGSPGIWAKWAGACMLMCVCMCMCVCACVYIHAQDSRRVACWQD